MAITQYQVFCRYLNETANRALTNKTTVEWISAEELSDLQKFKQNREEMNQYTEMKRKIINGELKLNQLDIQQLHIYNMGQRYDQVEKLTNEQKIAKEQCIIEPKDFLHSDTMTVAELKKLQAERDLELYEIVIEETRSSNPKYDMVFMYDGIGYEEADVACYNPDDNDVCQVPYVYYDKMKRVKLDPWFLFSTHASLNSAMTKAKELVNILGKDAVKIGKVVPLDQYIEIV